MSSVTRRSGYQGGILATASATYRDAGLETLTADDNTHTGILVTNPATTSAFKTGLARENYLTTETYTSAGYGTTTTVSSWRVTSSRVYN